MATCAVTLADALDWLVRFVTFLQMELGSGCEVAIPHCCCWSGVGSCSLGAKAQFMCQFTLEDTRRAPL